MTLTEGSPAFDAWQEADYPTFMKVYLFSVANSRDVEEKGTKPHIKEMGPYVFRYEEHNKFFLVLQVNFEIYKLITVYPQ